MISRIGAPNIEGLGKLRYVVEQPSPCSTSSIAFAVRYERRSELHDAFVSPACSLICWRCLNKRTS